MKRLILALLSAVAAFGQPSTPINNARLQGTSALSPTSAAPNPTFTVPSGATLTIASGGSIVAASGSTVTGFGGGGGGSPGGASGSIQYNNAGSFGGYPPASGFVPFMQAASSANLATLVTDENGSGKLIFSAGTLAVASGKTLTASNNITLTATDGSTLAIGAGGTLGSAAYTAASAYEVPLTFSTGLTRSTNTVTVNTSQNIATLSNLTTNGFVKTSGGTGALSVDTSSYVPAYSGLTTNGLLQATSATTVASTLTPSAITSLELTGGFYAGNQSAQYLIPSWNSQIAKIKNGDTVQAVLALIGDSWMTQGFITEPLITYLQNRFGKAGLGYVNANTAFAAPTGVTRNRLGTWGNGTYTSGVSNEFADSTDTATPASLAVAGVGTDFYIHYQKQPNGGSFRWNIDGGSWTTVATANASNLFAAVSITGNSVASHTINIEITVAGVAGVIINGVDCQLAAAGVRIHNLGTSGSTTANWVSQNATLWQDALTQLAPNTVGILLGVNDMSSNVVPATSAANLATLISRIQTALPLADIVLITPADIGLTQTYTMADYANAFRTQARTSGVGLIDALKLIPSYSAGDSRGLYTNTSHVNSYGGGLIAEYIGSFLGTTTPLMDPRIIDTGTNLALSKTALRAVTSGIRNTAVSPFSLDAATSGSYNVGVGYATLGATTTGTHNTAVGDNAGSINNGDRNVFLGDSAGLFQTAATDRLIIDNNNRGSSANELANALVYGHFDSSAAGQTLRINAITSVYGQLNVTRYLQGLNGTAGYLDFGTTTTSPITFYAGTGLGLAATLDTAGVQFNGTISGTSLKASGLTSGRVPFATTGGLLTDASSLTFNSGTGALTATSFVGAVTGNASTATALLNARTIGGSSFDGTANVTSFPSPGAIGGSTPAAGTFTAIVGTSVTDSGLTSGRVPFASTGGLLADASTFTFSGGTVTATNFAGTFAGNTITTGTGTLTLAASSSLITSGANAITLTSTGTTNVTLPTTGTLATLAGVESLSNKKIVKRVITTTDDSTAVIDVTLTDVYELTAVANNTTFSTTGTPVDGQMMVIRFKDAGVSKTLTWDAIFVVIGVTLPTATTAGKWHYVGVQYNSAASAFHVLAVSVQS